ncbi:DUF6716 putative glycosyltransferase [Psychrobacter sp. 78a-MNA-CIBAN-0178]|uniref:DUF6716 putative glycosyltransferase n=1 Tax=Psychrobacter sp. 78a-MNA-CIBAN-0178 TaxID=3140450 RepID=UPI003326CBCB
MKIAFLFKRDSHFKAVKSTALRVCAQYKCEATFIGIDAEVQCSHESCSIIYITKEDLGILVEYDYVIACLGGYLLNCTIAMLKDTDTKVISIFPGIVSHYQLDAFISRLNADQVWLNSKADFELYNNICRLFRCSNNGILYGMSWIDSYHSYNDAKDNYEEAIFFEQTEILNSKKSRRVFLERLDTIIKFNPEIAFKYKVRNNSTDSFFIELRKKINLYANVEVIDKLELESINRASYFLSISSSAIVEGLINNKKSYLIDCKLMDDDAKEFYEKSNLKLANINLKKCLDNKDQQWYSQRVKKPKINIELICINKRIEYLNINNRDFLNIRFFILKICIKHPHLLVLIFKKEKIKEFQKALEYL